MSKDIPSKIASAVKTLAKVGVALVLQILLFTGIGIILNIIAAIILISDVLPFPLYQSKVPVVTIAIIILVFLLLFPVIYFFVGKKQGIKAAISKILHEKGDSIIYFIVSKFTDRMTENGEWKASVQQNGVVKTVRNVFPGFIRTLNGLPWLLKRPLKMVFEAVDFAGAIEQAYKTRPDLPLNSPESNKHITESIGNKLRQKFPPPKGRLLLMMMAINISLAILAVIIL